MDIGAAIVVAAVDSEIIVAEGTEGTEVDGVGSSIGVLGTEAEAPEVVKRLRLFREYKAMIGVGHGSEHQKRDESTRQPAKLILSSCRFLDEALNL